MASPVRRDRPEGANRESSRRPPARLRDGVTTPLAARARGRERLRDPLPPATRGPSPRRGPFLLSRSLVRVIECRRPEPDDGSTMSSVASPRSPLEVVVPVCLAGAAALGVSVATLASTAARPELNRPTGPACAGRGRRALPGAGWANDHFLLVGLRRRRGRHLRRRRSPRCLARLRSHPATPPLNAPSPRSGWPLTFR